MNYKWSVAGSISNPYDKNPVVSRLYSPQITVQATSDYCVFNDTISVDIISSSGIYNDTALCSGELSLMLEFPYSPMSINGINTNEVTKTFYGDTTLSLYFRSEDGCWYNDTMNINFSEAVDSLLIGDTLMLCTDSLLELKTTNKLRTYKWSNGQSTPTIFINAIGTYSVEGYANGCSYEFTNFEVEKDILPTTFLNDTALCQHDIVELKNPFPEFEVLFRSPDLDFVPLEQDVLFVMTLGSSGCEITDSCIYSIIPHPNSFENIDVCFQTDSLLLDAQNADSYDWIGQNNYTQYLQPIEYITYTVERVNTDGCVDSFSFDLESTCPSKIFIPTAFTPNGDLLNSTFGPLIYGDYNNYTMKIYNRWGEQIFETQRGERWDGTYQGSIVQTGLYLAIIRVKVGNEFKYFSSQVTVVR
ncbi:MAG: gliding motility-associated-like protein [Bacteroidia bacterium]